MFKEYKNYKNFNNTYRNNMLYWRTTKYKYDITTLWFSVDTHKH